MKLIKAISDYYNNKIIEYGPVPRGVDWNSEKSQYVRFEKLLKIINKAEPFTVLDYGCGYGALYQYMKKSYKSFNYTGYDISNEMIKNAKELIEEENVFWTKEIKKENKYDFVIASGIFNVKLSCSNDEWEEYILRSLDEINQLCTLGFSFNILTSFSDIEKRKDYLFYGQPGKYFKHCKENYSKYVSLLHDYPLYEFTILVRKNINE